ncbi:YeeE/YedE family protein [Chloroflexi bacterium TSY]|nr:YeeE/YedE family protein [Chloroflexi bacterium TSY]
MKQNMIALIAGLLFGFGLALSQMIDPRRVLGLLDVAGTWDPTLLFVLGGAAGVTIVAFRFVLRQSAPFSAPVFQLPTKNDIDRPLLVGSALFGVGWGIAGYCPGPGITSLVLGSWNPVLFVFAMVVGSFFYSRIANWTSKPQLAHARTSDSSATT